jgi:hypothetical protein
MSKPDYSSSGTSEALQGFLDSLARFFLFAGGGALILGAAVVLINTTGGANATGPLAEQAMRNIELFGKIGMIGGIVAAIGASWLWWGEETLGPLLLIVGGALYFSTYFLPPALQITPNDVSASGLKALSMIGAPVGIIAIFDILADVGGRMRIRAREGARADQLKFGKGMKEERDIRNVFLGKCWQLPYCRKFVRERCPIYHSRRTCWNERVGCMCEESVIQNAMEGKVIPSDIVAAAKYIPKNAKLTPAQKAERCRQCVIYNEHQKHKYQLALPLSALALVGLYILVHSPLHAAVQGMLEQADKMMVKDDRLAGAGATDVTGITKGMIPYAEIIMVAGFLILFAYTVRVLEYLFFKAKV